MKRKKKSGKKFTSVAIPTSLFERIKERIEEADFTSVSDYVTYVLREILAEEEEEKSFTKEDEEQIKARLKALGYID